MRRARGAAAGLLEGGDLHGDVGSFGGRCLWCGFAGVRGELIDRQLDANGVRTAGERKLRNGLGLNRRDHSNEDAGTKEEHGTEEAAVHGKRDTNCAIEMLSAFRLRSHGDLAKDGDGPVKRLSHRFGDHCRVTSGMRRAEFECGSSLGKTKKWLYCGHTTLKSL